MFLVNSRPYHFPATLRGFGNLHPREHRFSRSYAVILPSSLTSVLSSALEYSSRQPVSVLVRTPTILPLGFFSEPLPIASPGNGSTSCRRLCQFSPDHPNTCTGATNARTTFYDPSSIGINASEWYGNIDPSSIDYAFRPRLRVRLTLGGIAFPRKP